MLEQSPHSFQKTIYVVKSMKRNDNHCIEIFLKQYPRGYNNGFVYKDIAPCVTTSSFEHNNFIIEIYENN